jgi:hypothetical protein
MFVQPHWLNYLFGGRHLGFSKIYIVVSLPQKSTRFFVYSLVDKEVFKSPGVQKS